MIKRVDNRKRVQRFMFAAPLVVRAGEEILLTTKGTTVVKAEVVKAQEPRLTPQEELNRRIQEENGG